MPATNSPWEPIALETVPHVRPAVPPDAMADCRMAHPVHHPEPGRSPDAFHSCAAAARQVSPYRARLLAHHHGVSDFLHRHVHGGRADGRLDRRTHLHGRVHPVW